MSSSDAMATMAPAWNTWSKSSGRSSSGSRAMSLATHTTPMASRSRRASGLPKRARPQTSLDGASSRTIGLARWPAGPVTRIFLPSMAPHHPDGDGAGVASLVRQRDEHRHVTSSAADCLHGDDERADEPRRHVVDVEAVDRGGVHAGVEHGAPGRLLDQDGGPAPVQDAVDVAQRLQERRLVRPRGAGDADWCERDELVDGRAVAGHGRRIVEVTVGPLEVRLVAAARAP